MNLINQIILLFFLLIQVKYLYVGIELIIILLFLVITIKKGTKLRKKYNIKKLIYKFNIFRGKIVKVNLKKASCIQ